jgi:hypothetical protein
MYGTATPEANQLPTILLVKRVTDAKAGRIPGRAWRREINIDHEGARAMLKPGPVMFQFGA